MGHNFSDPSHTLNVSGTISGSSDFNALKTAVSGSS